MGANVGKLPPEDISGYLLNLARELYRQYHSKLRSSQVCEKISQTLQERLSNLPEEQLLHLEKQLREKKITLPASFTENLTEDLRNIEREPLDYFTNQYVSIPQGIRGKTFSLPYLSEHVFRALEVQKGGLVFVEKKNAPVIKPTAAAAVAAVAATAPKEMLDDLNKELQETLKLGTIVPKNTIFSKVSKKEVEEEVCQLIAKHYMLRANLVGAITSTLPLSTDNPGFCQERIHALESGTICLPPDWFTEKTDEELAEDVGSYIQYFHKEQCERRAGRFRERSFNPNSLLGKTYLHHIEKMKQKYQVFLANMKEILETLMNKPLTNQDLYVLTKKTKDHLDTFYIQCQLDYILGVLTLLQMDSRKPPLSPQGEKNLLERLRAQD